MLLFYFFLIFYVLKILNLFYISCIVRIPQKFSKDSAKKTIFLVEKKYIHIAETSTTTLYKNIYYFIKTQA